MATNQEMLSQTYVKVHSMPLDVWREATVKRGGKQVSVIQELADCKTMVLECRAALAALTELVGQLATGRDIDYERIKAGTAEVIDAANLLTEGDVVSVDVNVTGK